MQTRKTSEVSRTGHAQAAEKSVATVLDCRQLLTESLGIFLEQPEFFGSNPQ
jgi:hypothetical protein